MECLFSDFKLANMAGKREERDRGAHQSEFILALTFLNFLFSGQCELRMMLCLLMILHVDSYFCKEKAVSVLFPNYLFQIFFFNLLCFQLAGVLVCLLGGYSGMVSMNILTLLL